MDIPVRNRGPPRAPPALPPPRYVHDAGPEDVSGMPHGHASVGGRTDQSRGSSTAGLSFPKSWGASMSGAKVGEGSKTSAVSSFRSPTDSGRRYDASRFHDEGYYSLSSSSAMYQQLPGERQLHHRDQEKSSQAYDKNLLSRIGKPSTTPPRTSAFGGSVGSSIESSPTSVLSFSQRHPSQFRSLSFPNSASSTLSDPPIKQEPLSRVAEISRSRPISPVSASSAVSTKFYTDYRSPTLDHSSRSSTLDPDSFSQYPQRFPSSTNVLRQQKSRRSGSGSLLSQFDESAYITTNEVKRENHDQLIFSEPDSTFRMEETVRQLHLEDRTSLAKQPDSTRHLSSESYHQPHSAQSRPGMKRKHPPEGPHEGAQLRATLLQQAASNADQYSNNASQHLSAQSGNQFAQHQAPIPLQSAGTYLDNSYASSGGHPVGESSYPGIDQHSPDRMSPTSTQQNYPQLNAQDPQYTSTLSVNTIPQNARSGPYPQAQQPSDNRSTSTRKGHDNSSRKQNPPSMQKMFSCSCCPKKPRKFDTQEKLDQHQSEKQHSCMWCHNRFKNKNEAERHQNSLHRRLHSWSCAALAHDYSAAFFRSTSIPAANASPNQRQQNPQPTNGVASHDVCGYCGDEFPNEPSPNWEERQHHLVTQHKFGDCNQTKKFFRADHFRQHLKHSHGGKSGKHTNSLEQACVRDEPPAIPTDDSQSGTPTQIPSAPVANMGNLAPPNMSHGEMGQPDISQSRIQQQMSSQSNMAQQGTMGTPIASMDMTNIDPKFSYMPQQQGMQMPSGGGAYGQMKEEL
ncbi:MAG: hypothetical protein Q9217_006177 [Psora testacea]